LTEEEIRAFLQGAGVHLYAASGDVLYLGNGYLGLHAAMGGEKTLRLPAPRSLVPVFGTMQTPSVTDTLFFTLEQHQTVLFLMDGKEE
jgi:hypothetical protein